jgi:hypothetical protein
LCTGFYFLGKSCFGDAHFLCWYLKSVIYTRDVVGMDRGARSMSIDGMCRKMTVDGCEIRIERIRDPPRDSFSRTSPVSGSFVVFADKRDENKLGGETEETLTKPRQTLREDVGPFPVFHDLCHAQFPCGKHRM